VYIELEGERNEMSCGLINGYFKKKGEAPWIINV